MGVSVDTGKPTRVRSFIGTKKVMTWVCFSRSGIGNVLLLPSKETLDREFFVEKVLADFDKERARNWPRKQSRDTFFYLDNTTPHRAPQDFDRLGIARLHDPRYSADLAS
jgi:hypothetical protein